VYSIALSAFQCQDGGISEAYVGYNWAREIARFADVKLLTANSPAGLPANVQVLTTSRPFAFSTPGLANFNRAVKLDYFWHNLLCRFRHRRLLSSTDIFHHVTPIAPRFPNSLGRLSSRFVLGPIGGGLRVPPPFRGMVETAEPVYAALRNFDRLRLDYDPSLRSTYKAARKILIVAKYMLDLIPEEFHDKTEIVLETGIRGADFQEYAPAAAGKQFTLLYVGHIIPYKGLEFLVRALGKVNGQTRRALHLQVIGDGGAYAGKCKKIVHQLGLADRVTFHGRLPHEQVMQWYRRADALCFPTLAETSGNVILEGMAMRLPVISVNYGGPSEIVDSNTGILIDPLDPDYLVLGIAAALERLVANPEGARSLGAAARRRVLDEFSWEAKGRKIRSIYDAIMQDGPAGRGVAEGG
jgi:glycosyltransferase involved in cell wall biosynthesis